MLRLFFFYHATARTEIYTLSLHDALPILHCAVREKAVESNHQRLIIRTDRPDEDVRSVLQDRKSTRLNSSHVRISYAVFCLKKKRHRSLTIPHRNRYTPPLKTPP